MSDSDGKTLWHAHLGAISIGEQCGGSEDGGIGDLKVELWMLLKEHCNGSYCPTVDHFALALRVGGPVADWTPERVHRGRRNRRDRYIGCDIDIPRAAWRKMNLVELRDYLAERVQFAILMLVKRLRRDKEDVDERRLLQVMNASLADFRARRPK